MEVQAHTLCLFTQPKKGQQFKNKKHPELTENRTVWKSDNQGDKEETLTQTGRRGGDGQPGREDSRQGGGWWTQRSLEQGGQSCSWPAKQQLVDQVTEPRNPEFHRGETQASYH